MAPGRIKSSINSLKHEARRQSTRLLPSPTQIRSLGVEPTQSKIANINRRSHFKLEGCMSRSIDGIDVLALTETEDADRHSHCDDCGGEQAKFGKRVVKHVGV